MRVSIALVAAGGFGVSGVALAGDVLYAQTPSEGSGAISVRDGNTVFAFANRRRADNFFIGSDFEIERIRFWGGDETSDATPDLENLSGFNLRIHESVGGAPGAVIFERTVGTALTSPTANGLSVGLLGAPMYEFTVELATPAAFDGGEYFFSVGAIFFSPVDFTNESWQWAGSQPGDGVFFSDRFDGNGYQPLTGGAVTNLAFEIVGVPAPSGAACLGIFGLLSARRRRV